MLFCISCFALRTKTNSIMAVFLFFDEFFHRTPLESSGDRSICTLMKSVSKIELPILQVLGKETI